MRQLPRRFKIELATECREARHDHATIMSPKQTARPDQPGRSLTVKVGKLSRLGSDCSPLGISAATSDKHRIVW